MCTVVSRVPLHFILYCGNLDYFFDSVGSEQLARVLDHVALCHVLATHTHTHTHNSNTNTQRIDTPAITLSADSSRGAEGGRNPRHHRAHISHYYWGNEFGLCEDVCVGVWVWVCVWVCVYLVKGMNNLPV